MASSSFPWLPVLTGIAYTFGLVWAWRKIGDYPGKYAGISVQARRDWLLPASLALLIGALIGSRLGYILVHPGQYQVHPDMIFRLWDGGLDWIGIPIGMGISCLLYAGLKNAPPLVLLEDQISIWVLVAISWWLACGFYGLYYGSPAPDATWAPRLVDAMGDYSARIPLSWIGAFATCLTGLFLEWLANRWKLQHLFMLAWVSQFGLLVSLSYFREDPVAPIAGFPSDRLAGLVYLLLGLSFWLILFFTKRMKTRDLVST